MSDEGVSGKSPGKSDRALRRALRVMNEHEALDSAAPSILLGAIVTSMVTIAFVVLGVVRGEFLLATISAGVAGALWWKYLRSTRRTKRPSRQQAKS